MRKIFVVILLLIGFTSFGQTPTEDTTNYMRYPLSAAQFGKLWPKSVLKLPDTTVSQHAVGNFARNAAGTKVFISDGVNWNEISGTGSGGSSTVDTIYSVIVNSDTIYSIMIRSDTIHSVITNSDTIYSIVLRTDTIFSNVTNTDTIYSITSRSDTLLVNNYFVIPVRDTGDYQNPVQGSVTFAPSDSNYYGYNGNRWLCFSCSDGQTCYRDIIITSAQFSDANTCTDASIVGMIYDIYWDDLPGYIQEGTDYTLNGNGFDINIASFDATAENYNFHVYTVDTSGACENVVVINAEEGGGAIYSFQSPLSESLGNVSISNAGVDGTKGAVTFDPDFFNTTNGLATIDIANFQKATTGQAGLMTAAQVLALANAVVANGAITGATKTKITYDSKGLVTAGADATTSDIAEGSNLYFTNARVRGAISLTTTGNSGAATYNSSTGVLNVPVYTGGLTDITGLIEAGTNVTLDGSGTSGDPYVINASGGGGGSGTVESFSFTNGNGFTGTVTNATTTPALSLTAQNGAADGVTKGFLGLSSADFNTTSGIGSLDYPNMQIVTALVNGIVTPTLFNTWNAKQPAIIGGATSIVSSNLTASRALVSDASGKVAAGSATSTELGFLSGVSSAIQTQLNNKQSTTLSSGNILVGNGSNVAASVTMSGDVTINSSGVTEVTNITGFISAGSNVTVTGSGTTGSPYVISSSGGGGGGSTDTTSLSARIDRINLRFTIQTLTPANTVTMNLNSGHNATLLLNRATTTLLFSNIASGDEGYIELTQDGTGGREIVLPSGSTVANGFGGGTSITLSTGAGAVDVIYYKRIGSAYRWTIAKNFQ